MHDIHPQAGDLRQMSRLVSTHVCEVSRHTHTTPKDCSLCSPFHTQYIQTKAVTPKTSRTETRYRQFAHGHPTLSLSLSAGVFMYQIRRRCRLALSRTVNISGINAILSTPFHSTPPAHRVRQHIAPQHPAGCRKLNEIHVALIGIVVRLHRVSRDGIINPLVGIWFGSHYYLRLGGQFSSAFVWLFVSRINYLTIFTKFGVKIRFCW